jgi:hypothetical protein
MAIESVGASGPWIEFMRAAEAARRRNNGLTTTTTAREGLPTRHVATQEVVGARTPLASRLYAPAGASTVPQAKAGSMFDAYA